MTALKAVFAVMAIFLALLAASPVVMADETDTHAAVRADREQLAREIQQAYQKAERSQRLQTDLPLELTDDLAQTNKRQKKPLTISENFARLLLILAVIIIVGIIALALYKNLWGKDLSKELADKSQNAADGDGRPDEAAARRMDDARLTADDLAQQGRYTEAMHLLLLQSVNELRRRLAVSIADSLTSREILQRIGLPDAGKRSFGDIIRRVEISYFGTHEPGAEDYAACRASYHDLTDVLRQGRPAS